MSKKIGFKSLLPSKHSKINGLKEPDGKQKFKTKSGLGAWCPAKSPRNSASKGPVPIFLGLCWVPGSWANTPGSEADFRGYFALHQRSKPFIREVSPSSEK